MAGHAALGAPVYTDDVHGYKEMSFNHESVNHSADEYVRGMAHTQGIESFWSMLKRACKGIVQMGFVATGIEGECLRYQDLIADDGLDAGARA